MLGDMSLAAAAHELKSPLVLIRQLSLLAADTTIGLSDHQLYMQRITLTSERSLRLVELLTRQVHVQQSELSLEPVNTTHVCEEVAHELLPLFRASGVRLELRRPRRSVLALAHHDLLQAVTTCLCDNALQHAGDGGVVQLGTAQRAGGTRSLLSVRDFGSQLSRSALTKLRGALGSSSQPLSASPRSSGLGLYIAAQYAVAMKARLGMVAHRSPGSTFYIDAPTSAQLSFVRM